MVLQGQTLLSICAEVMVAHILELMVHLHNQLRLSYFSNITKCHCPTPMDDVSTRVLTNQLAEMNQPSYTRTARNKTPVLYDGREEEVIIGKGITLKEGNDVAIIACGVMVSEVMKAAEH